MRRRTPAHPPLAAAAALALLCAAGAGRADVVIGAVDASYYHFGAAYLDGFPYTVLQSAPPAPPLQHDDGIIAFSVASGTIPVTTAVPGGVQIELRTTHKLTASADVSAPTGMAQAGAGTFVIFVDLVIEGEGIIYTGDLPLVRIDDDGEFASGSEVPPGVYSFAVSRWKIFAVDAQLLALAGQASSVEARGFSPVLRFARHAACPADWNTDGAVNSADITAFVETWLSCVGGGGGGLLADFNADGAVNSQDLTAFIAAWLGAVHGC